MTGGPAAGTELGFAAGAVHQRLAHAPNPAGLIGTPTVKFRDGRRRSRRRPTAPCRYAKGGCQMEYRSRRAAGLVARHELGPLGMRPWGDVERPRRNCLAYPDANIVHRWVAENGVPRHPSPTILCATSTGDSARPTRIRGQRRGRRFPDGVLFLCDRPIAGIVASRDRPRYAATGLMRCAAATPPAAGVRAELIRDFVVFQRRGQPGRPRCLPHIGTSRSQLPGRRLTWIAARSAGRASTAFRAAGGAAPRDQVRSRCQIPSRSAARGTWPSIPSGAGRPRCGSRSSTIGVAGRKRASSTTPARQTRCGKVAVPE